MDLMMNPIMQSAVNALQSKLVRPVPGAQPVTPAPAAAAPINNAFAARAGIPARGTIMPARPPMAAMPVMARPVMPAGAAMPPAMARPGLPGPGAAPVGAMMPQNALARRFATAY